MTTETANKMLSEGTITEREHAALMHEMLPVSERFRVEAGWDSNIRVAIGAVRGSLVRKGLLATKRVGGRKLFWFPAA